MELGIGKKGVAIVVALFLILTAEDLIIWIRNGAVPGLEFFLGVLLVLVVVILAIREARSHPPPRR